MTNEQFNNLRRGDIVRGRLSGTAYVIDSNIGSGFIGVNTVLLTHADEWEYYTPKDKELAANERCSINNAAKHLHQSIKGDFRGALQHLEEVADHIRSTFCAFLKQSDIYKEA